MSPRFSVVVPVKDGARYLREVLEAVRGQDEAVELLVVDSGSSDDSVAIARAAGADVLEIAAANFGHGSTRNLAAERTSGQLICFLTQDATPLPGWLAAYREAFELGGRVGAAYGPHLPRPDTTPMIARELVEFFAGFSPDREPVVQRAGDPSFLANVNACYRRECWEEIRFDEVPYSEDQAFGRALLAAGWEKVYHPGARVLHAHDYGPVDFMRRYFDEYRGLRETIGHVERIGVRSTVRDVRALVARDRGWMREQGWERRGQARWTARSVVHHGGRKAFSALGSRAHSLPPAVQRRVSLEGTVATAPPELVSPAGTGSALRTTLHTTVRPSPFEPMLERARAGVTPLVESDPGEAERTPLHIAVVIPPFRRGSGGHNSIFQMLTRLERKGHTCSVWLHDPLGWLKDDWPGKLRGDIREFFAPLEGPVFRGFEHWYGADVAVATGWETVYPVLGLDACRSRAYLIHDHENEFFATSAEYRWAADTYGYNLHPIAASPWLRDLVLRRYGAPAASEFNFGVDRDVYRPRPVERRRDTVVFYGRNVTPRRAVPLGVLALQELHRRRPELRIVLYGDPDPIDAPFPYEHLGIASPDELAAVFSEATVGLCLSMTNYSLMPQEMLACGLPCIDLAGFSAETVFGADGPVELAPFDPLALADAMERLIDDEQLWERRSRAGLSFVAGRTWDHAADQLEEGLREALRRAGAGGEELMDRSAAGAGVGQGGVALSRSVPVDTPPGGGEATRRLYDRLAPEDIAEVEDRLEGVVRWYWENTHDPELRKTLALHFGVWYDVSQLLEKTGLRRSEPPEGVHAMARGHLSAGGAFYYADMIAAALRRTGPGLEDVTRGLDFGCSSGRVVRALAAAYPEVEWHGSEPNAEAVGWAQEYLGGTGIHFLHAPQDPPLPYDDSLFDLVAAISIWSHFDEASALGWLAEMHRIIRPGGRLFLTVHGYQSIAFYEREGLRPLRQLEEIREALYRRGFWFRAEFGEAGDHGVKHSEWGTAFMTPEWLLQRVLPAWRLEDWAVGQNADNQDVVVLSRR